MKRLLLLCVTLLMFTAIQAQAQAQTGSIAGTVTDTDGATLPGASSVSLDVLLQKGTNTVYRGDGFTFSVEVEMLEITDGDRVLHVPDLEIVGIAFDGNIASRELTEIADPTAAILACPDGFAATYVADETRQYQMGYCALEDRSALVHVNGTFGRGTVGVDLNDEVELPFWFSFPAEP